MIIDAKKSHAVNTNPNSVTIESTSEDDKVQVYSHNKKKSSSRLGTHCISLNDEPQPSVSGYKSCNASLVMEVVIDSDDSIDSVECLTERPKSSASDVLFVDDESIDADSLSTCDNKGKRPLASSSSFHMNKSKLYSKSISKAETLKRELDELSSILPFIEAKLIKNALSDYFLCSNRKYVVLSILIANAEKSGMSIPVHIHQHVEKLNCGKREISNENDVMNKAVHCDEKPLEVTTGGDSAQVPQATGFSITIDSRPSRSVPLPILPLQNTTLSESCSEAVASASALPQTKDYTVSEEGKVHLLVSNNDWPINQRLKSSPSDWNPLPDNDWMNQSTDDENDITEKDEISGIGSVIDGHFDWAGETNNFPSGSVDVVIKSPETSNDADKWVSKLVDDTENWPQEANGAIKNWNAENVANTVGWIIESKEKWVNAPSDEGDVVEAVVPNEVEDILAPSFPATENSNAAGAELTAAQNDNEEMTAAQNDEAEQVALQNNVDRQNWVQEKIALVASIAENVNLEVISERINYCYSENDIILLIDDLLTKDTDVPSVKIINALPGSDPGAGPSGWTGIKNLPSLPLEAVSSNSNSPSERSVAAVHQENEEATITIDAAVTNEEENEDDDWLETQTVTICELFPDADPEFLHKKLLSLIFINGL